MRSRVLRVATVATASIFRADMALACRDTNSMQQRNGIVRATVTTVGKSKTEVIAIGLYKAPLQALRRNSRGHRR